MATVDEILRRLGEAESVFCLLDYDGTLAPIAPTPDEALPVPGTAQLLARLAAAPGTQVAIISGRTIESVRRLLDVPGAYYIGIHGIELYRPDGTGELANGLALVCSFLPVIKRRLEEELVNVPGILIEDKGAALACHHRLAVKDDAIRARQTVTRIARLYQRRGLAIDVLYGHTTHTAMARRGVFAPGGKSSHPQPRRQTGAHHWVACLHRSRPPSGGRHSQSPPPGGTRDASLFANAARASAPGGGHDGGGPETFADSAARRSADTCAGPLARTALGNSAGRDRSVGRLAVADDTRHSSTLGR